MRVPLTACKVKLSLGCLRSAQVGGSTLTSAPVSTRKRRPWLRSMMKKRRLGTRPGTPVAASDWPGRFPDGDMVNGTWWQHPQNFGDTNTGLGLHWCAHGERGWVSDCERGWESDGERGWESDGERGWESDGGMTGVWISSS